MKPGEVDHWFEIPKRPPPVLEASGELLEVLKEKQKELPGWRMGDQDWRDRKRKLQIIFNASPDPTVLTQVIKDGLARTYMFR